MTLIMRLIHSVFVETSIRTRITQFSILKDHSSNGVIFLGDSITAGGLWQEWFPESAVRNRGIDGDTTAGVLSRLDSAVDGTPRAVFLLIGTNDIGLGVNREATVRNVDSILSFIRRSSPSTTIYLQSVMPRARRYATRIHWLNDQYRELADTHGAIWIDLWPTLRGSSDAIRGELSLDRLHLNGDGYKAWAEVIGAHVRREGDTETSK